MTVTTVHEAAAFLAAQMATLWAKDCGRFGDAREHFEIRVWDGKVLVLRALTPSANGWHRVQTIREGRSALNRHGNYRVISVFSPHGADFVADVKAATSATEARTA